MVTLHRRSTLKLLGTAALGIATIGTASGREPKKKGRIRKLGHSLLSNPPGGYAESEVRDDGQYAVLGSFFGTGGSFLVDISNPRDPTEVHQLPSPPTVRNADVKFDPRDGLYYRSQEPNVGDAEFDGVEIIDYGFADGTPEEPEILGSLASGSTHNLFLHPNAPFIYTTEEDGMGIFDVSDPAQSEIPQLGTVGPDADLHDIVVDPDREWAHLAFIGGGFDGYVIMDVSDPANPTEVGRFDYAGRPSYEDVDIGEEGFDSCHYANYDPARDIAVVGDEIAAGKPGGKHVMDISDPSNIVSVGFTLSPNAQEMAGTADEIFDWTTHNHDIIPKGSNSLLVDGGYHDGVWVADISDPTEPTPTDQYLTDDGATDEVNDDPIFDLGEAPMAWGANYNKERDIVVASDFFTGVYVFKVTPAAPGGSGNGGGNGNGN